ncbi:hypothetical protein [Haliangium ochraceum]|uniref:Uncharacterized protein n=1 Tax=Haliangium ochraceum (strain DSM 14365 / JCM 11303 / SMP-2) TaxID=502025 RepID=D0LQR5_HALO1|nr:hypothetical protein [Haliangium ochraceum]ACY13625.1 conserved hypothetical protein [Haliangium ochraceum DSM 14365]
MHEVLAAPEARNATQRPEMWSPAPPEDEIAEVSSLKEALLAEVYAPHNFGLFERTRMRRAALRPYACIRQVVALLLDESPMHEAAKDVLVRAFVGEQRKRPHPFWSALLLLSASPILARLSKRIQCDPKERDELVQIIVTIFLDVARTFPLSRHRNRTFMHLRQTTQRRVFQHLRERQREADTERCQTPEQVFDRRDCLAIEGYAAHWPETQPTPSEPCNSGDPDEGVAKLGFLLQHAGPVLRGETLQLIQATLVRGERLSDFVDRVYDDETPAQRRRRYDAIKHRHQRAIRALRTELADLHEALRDAPDAFPTVIYPREAQ